MMKRCILCLAALALAACGAAGPLYLPGHEKHKSGLLSKEQRKTGATPASASPADAPATAQPPAAPDAAAAPKPDASPGPAPAAPPPANPEPAPPQP